LMFNMFIPLFSRYFCTVYSVSAKIIFCYGLAHCVSLNDIQISSFKSFSHEIKTERNNITIRALGFMVISIFDLNLKILFGYFSALSIVKLLTAKTVPIGICFPNTSFCVVAFASPGL
jgi:hypothetical protein